jgi:hypothetical protein
MAMGWGARAKAAPLSKNPANPQLIHWAELRTRLFWAS